MRKLSSRTTSHIPLLALLCLPYADAMAQLTVEVGFLAQVSFSRWNNFTDKLSNELKQALLLAIQYSLT